MLEECAASELRVVHPKRVLKGALTRGDIVTLLNPRELREDGRLGLLIQVHEHSAIVLWTDKIHVDNGTINYAIANTAWEIQREEDARIMRVWGKPK